MDGNYLSYAASFIPLISSASLYLLLCLISLTILIGDTLNYGCLAWHRDSIGVLVQKLCFGVCLLMTLIFLYQFVKDVESGHRSLKLSMRTLSLTPFSTRRDPSTRMLNSLIHSILLNSLQSNPHKHHNYSIVTVLQHKESGCKCFYDFLWNIILDNTPLHY